MLQFTQSLNPEKFVGPQWIVTALPAKRQLLMLCGILVIDFRNNQKQGWRGDSVEIYPDSDIRSAITYAGVPPPKDGFEIKFVAEQYTTFGAMNSIFDQDASVNAGFAVDSFGPIFYPAVTRQLTGIRLNVAVQDQDAALLRVGYQLTAVGRFEQIAVAPIL